MLLFQSWVLIVMSCISLLSRSLSSYLFACTVCCMRIDTVCRNHRDSFSECYGLENGVSEGLVLHGRALHDNDYRSSGV